MTKQEFENNEEPLCMIISFNPKSGKVLYDTFEYESSEMWLDKFKKDFPDYMHFIAFNKAAKTERRKNFGLK